MDAPLPTTEELVAQAEQTRQALLKRVDEVTTDWRVELALEDISEGAKAKLSAWMNYKREIKAVNVSTAPFVK
nr:tail fiber assembly protein [Pseudescherichia vulneris]